MQETHVKNGRIEFVLMPQRAPSSGKEHSTLQELHYTQHQFLDHTHQISGLAYLDSLAEFSSNKIFRVFLSGDEKERKNKKIEDFSC